MFLAITESKKIVSGEGDDSQVSFEKHKIFLYKEDFEKFMNGLQQAIQFIAEEQGPIEPHHTENEEQETTLFLCLRHHIGQNGQSLINGLVKLLFFLGNYLEDKFLFLFQFGISILGAFDHILCQFNQELSRNVKQPSVPAGAPQETPEHISTALVARHDSVRDHKGYGTDMVGDDTQGDIRLFIPAIFGMGQSADMIP